MLGPADPRGRPLTSAGAGTPHLLKRKLADCAQAACRCKACGSLDSSQNRCQCCARRCHLVGGPTVTVTVTLTVTASDCGGDCLGLRAPRGHSPGQSHCAGPSWATRTKGLSWGREAQVSWGLPRVTEDEAPIVARGPRVVT